MKKQTKKKIIDAFSKLVSERSYDEVTVEMIIQEADIGKTTFYRYFHDKADVMSERFKMIYDEAIISSECKSLEDLFETLLRQARNLSFLQARRSILRKQPQKLPMCRTSRTAPLVSVF